MAITPDSNEYQPLRVLRLSSEFSNVISQVRDLRQDRFTPTKANQYLRKSIMWL